MAYNISSLLCHSANLCRQQDLFLQSHKDKLINLRHGTNSAVSWWSRVAYLQMDKRNRDRNEREYKEEYRKAFDYYSSLSEPHLDRALRDWEELQASLPKGCQLSIKERAYHAAADRVMYLRDNGELIGGW